MIRVTKTEEPSKTVVTIDGQLSGKSIGLVETSCKEAESAGKPVYLFLRDVTTIDDAGRLLLRHLAGNGVRVSGRGVYTSYVVESWTTDHDRQSCLIDADDGVNRIRGKAPSS
jgi:hypothetical protein